MVLLKRRELTDEELAIRIQREYDNASAYEAKNWKRCVENWRMYWGIDNDKGFGQWPPEVAAKMISQGRQIATFNLCRPTVDTIAGGICKAPFSFDYSPIETEADSLTYRIKDLQYQEQELMDWRSEELELYLGGLTYQGNWEMYLSEEYTKKGSGVKNIGFRTLLPGAIKYDPRWKSARSKKCKKAWKDRWMTPLEMLELWGDDKKTYNGICKAVAFKKGGQAELERLIELQEMLGDDYGYNTGIIPYMSDDVLWGGQYKVVMQYYMKTVKIEYEYCLMPDGERITIPSKLKDAQDKIEWLNANVPDWQPDAIFIDEAEEEVQYMAAICPGLMQGMLICDGPTEVQCGRLQFFPWSAYRINGEIGGIIDSIKDMQTSVNYINSRLTYREQTDGGGGSQFSEEGAFVSPEEYQRYLKERNDPSAVFQLMNGTLLRYPNGPAIPTNKSPYPRELLDRLNHIIDNMWGKISKHHDVDQGISNESGQSGYKYNLQKMQSDISKHTIYEGLRNFWNEVGEAYLYQAINIHGNGVERTFNSMKTGKSFTINKRQIEQDDVTGELLEIIVDDISKLKEIRHKVMVVESADSPSRKFDVMQSSSQLLDRTDAKVKPLTYQRLSAKLTESVDVFSEEEKMQLKSDAELELDVAREELGARKARAKLERMQALMQANPPPAAPTHPVTGKTAEEMGVGGSIQGGGGAAAPEPAMSIQQEEIAA